MHLPPKLCEYDERLRSEIRRVSPPERFQRLDDEHRFDDDLHGALGAAGVWGLGVPEADGGTGGDTLCQMVALRALGDQATSMGMFAVVHLLCTRILNACADEGQRRTWLRPLAAGRIKASFCLTERQGGTDILRVMATQASRVDNGWVLDGSKTWICGALGAAVLVVVARTGPGKTDGVSMFLVPCDAPGVRVTRIRTFAVNAYEVCDVRLDGVRVPGSALLGEEGQGFRQLLSMLNGERLSASANALGMAQGALALASEHARSRQAFGKSLSELQAVQHKVANAAVAYEVAWTYLCAAAREQDGGRPIDVASSVAKLAAVQAAQQAADIGMEILGAAAFDVSNPMQRYYRDHRLYVIAPLNNDMSRSLVAERYFGFARST